MASGRPDQKVSKKLPICRINWPFLVTLVYDTTFTKCLSKAICKKRMLLNRNGLTMTNWSDWTFCYQNPHPSFKNMHLARQCHSFSKKEEELHDHVTWGGWSIAWLPLLHLNKKKKLLAVVDTENLFLLIPPGHDVNLPLYKLVCGPSCCWP